MDNNNSSAKKPKRRYGGTTAAKRQNGPRAHNASANNGRVRKTRSGYPRTRTGGHSEKEEEGTSQGEGCNVEYERSSTWEDMDKYVLWPAWVTLVVYLITLTSRVWMVSDKAHWWVLHPDEVFQSLEVAHSEVYGYGFRPYEFLPPHAPGNEMTSLAEKQEAEMGMYSLRSWLYPRLYMAVFHINDYFGGTQGPFLVGKVFHAVVAAHLPLAVYFFTAHITLSTDIATSAAILVSFSEHLAVLGTHTLVNSFLSPIVFLALAFLYPLLIDDPIVGGSGPMDGNDASSGDSDSGSTSCSGTPIKDVNGNAKSQMADLGEETADSQIAYSNISSGVSNEDLNISTEGNESTMSYFVIGVILALLCYIRVDLLLFLGLLVLFLFTDVLLHPLKHLRQVVLILAGGATGVLLGGLDDLFSYGTFLMSPFQWFRFNILTDLPNIIFGWASSWTYIEYILNYNMVTRIQTVIVIIAFVFALCRLFFVEYTARNRQLDKCLVRLVLATVSMFTIYSLKGHKEVRFLHNVIVLFQISCALSFTILYRKLIDTVQAWNNMIKLHGRMVFVLFTTSLLLNFPSAKDRSNQVWAYKGVWDSNHINECLDFIRQQPDVTGLFSDRSIHENAAYSVLHQDIPIFSLFHNEFMEFDKTVRKTLPSNNYFSPRDSVAVTVTSQISNFITTDNSPLLLKAIVNEPNYNYLVLKTSRKLVNTGFDEVFQSGTMRVMRRTQKPREAEELQQIADSIPIGRNATVLEYEGSWLMTYGLRQIAMGRLETAIALDTSRIRAFQLLALIYRDLGRTQDARRISARCYQYNGKGRCLEMQPKVVLHPDHPN